MTKKASPKGSNDVPDDDPNEELDIASEDQGIQVDIDEDIAQGVYSNLVISNYSQEEFVIDFVFLQPQMPKGKTLSRVILSPKNTKRLIKLLQQHVGDFEQKYGKVTDDPGQTGINFSVN